MTTKIPRLLLMGAMLTPTTLYALGLGEIRLNSALNQPFDAEIELISPTTEELQSLKVGLASADAFSRYGVDRPAFLSDFRFRVSRADDGSNVLRITSADTVTEPFVTFIVEAGWSRGRLLREYTVLLDPPVYMPAGAEAAAPVATPRAGARSEGVIERPREPAPRPARAAPSAPTPTPSAYPGGTYTVQRNDTLWRIASRIRPGSTRVVNQTMMAIYSANPQAFDGNINLLRSGAVLQIPDEAAIEQISASDASRAVSAQYEAWREGTDAGDSGRLRLVAPQQAAAPGARAAEQPRPSTAASDDTALRSRVDQLESELTEARRLLELRNAELAEMQRRLTESGGEAAVEPVVPAEPEAQAPPAVVEEPVVEEPVAGEPPTPEPAAEPAAQPQRPAATAPAVREPEPTLLERIGDYWWALVVLGLAILAGLLLYFRKRRQPDIDDALETLTPKDFATKRPSLARAPSDAFEVEETEAGDVAARTSRTVIRGAPGAAAAAAAAAEEPSADDTISEPGIAFDQQDALAEADFHMAYGLYDQAADLVKLAIQQEPGRRDLKLKLLEIYFVWGNKDMFLETARDLDASRASAEPGEWDKVLIMGKQICPDEPLFQAAMSRAGSVRSVDLNLEGGENRVDVDLFAEPGESESAAGLDLEFNDQPAAADARRIDDTGIDFLLDEPQRGGTDFDLGDDTMARTQETPTVENKAIDSATHETVELDAEEETGSRRPGVEQTAELAIDDLGIDVDSFADTDDHELEGDDGDLQAPRSIESTGTILLDEEALMSSSSTAEQPQLDVSGEEVDFDLGNLDDDGERRVDSTAEWAAGSLSETISDADFDEVNLSETREGPALSATSEMKAPPLGEEVADDDEDEFKLADTRSGQGITSTRTMEAPDLSELEPVTMSEVGTKLDLARAYVDMGDPDGARSILEEVLQEGSTSQKEEAQRLLESIV